ncbi:S8 family serine peptidase [Thermaurantiacus sp.]
MMPSRPLFLVLLAGAALSACASSGSAPAPTTPGVLPPPPPPTPTPASVFDTPEYRRTATATGANVLPVWAAGHEGQGITVGLVDTGIAVDSPEFAGRIAPQSRDVTGAGRSIRDEDGHGTAVAGILAAARNDRSIVGIAPRATIAMMRGDRAGSCATEPGCGFTDAALAAGINAVVDAGARVLNISLGGSSGSSAVRSAWARATSAGTILVIGAGNDSAAEIDPLPRSALAAANPALVIVVGAATTTGEIASFSNRAGSAAANYLLAPGVSVRSFDHNGTEFLYSGTSLAAPVVAGAAALLAGAFPNLSGAQIVELLLMTADDRGAPGADPVTGRGLLNIGRAFQPQGTTRLAGAKTPVSLTMNGSLGPAMGPSFGTSLGQVAIEDAYGRPYTLAIGTTLRPASPARLAAALLAPPVTAAALTIPSGALRLTLAGARRAQLPGLPTGADPDVALGLAQRGLGPFSALTSRLADGSVALASGSFRLAAGTGTVAPPLPGEIGRRGLVAPDALAPMPGAIQGRLAAQIELGRLTFALAHTRTGLARTVPGRPVGPAGEAHVNTLALATRASAFGLTLQLAQDEERDGLLGTRLGPAFGLEGSKSRSLGGALDLALAPFGFGPVELRLAISRGWHTPRLAERGLLIAADGVQSTAWSAELAAPLGPGQLHLIAAAPQALAGGAFRFAAAPGEIRLVPAEVTRRESLVEGGYALGPVMLSLYHRRHAGHVDGVADHGGAIRFRLAF